MKILLVEAKTYLSEITSQILSSRLSAQVICARNGQEAIEKVQSEETVFDLIISEVDLPVMTGIEMIDQLHASNYPAKIIILTMLDHPDTLRTVLAREVHGFILKEGDVNDLIFGIEAVLSGERFLSPAIETSMERHDVPRPKTYA